MNFIKQLKYSESPFGFLNTWKFPNLNSAGLEIYKVKFCKEKY